MQISIGPGLLETVYEVVLAWELQDRGLTVERVTAAHKKQVQTYLRLTGCNGVLTELWRGVDEDRNHPLRQRARRMIPLCVSAPLREKEILFPTSPFTRTACAALQPPVMVSLKTEENDSRKGAKNAKEDFGTDISPLPGALGVLSECSERARETLTCFLRSPQKMLNAIVPQRSWW